MIDYTKPKETLTRQQQKAIHVYFGEVADELNNQGITQRALLEKLKWIEVPNSKDSIKALWKCLQEAQFDKKSTTELNTDEVSQVYDTFNKAIGQDLGVFIPFPSLEELNK